MRIFLGSSKESIVLVEWASKFLAEDLAEEFNFNPLPWNSREAFPAGLSTLDSLKKLLEEVDGAIMFVTADDVTEHRGVTTPTPRDNIIFEAGLFLGGLGAERTHLVVQHGVGLRLPSDLLGITHESFKDIKENPAISLAHTVRAIATGLKALRPRGTPHIIRELQQREDIGGINAAVGPFRRVVDEAIYPRVGRPDVREVDAIVQYRFNEVATRLGPNLQRKEFALRLCLPNMWDNELVQIYLRKFTNRTAEDIQVAVREAITVTLGKLRDWSEPAHRGQAPRFVPESPPPAKIKIYLTSQRVTHAYYRIDNLMCIVPLDMKTSAEPPPCAWVFVKDQNGDAYSYYKEHFESVVSEGICIYPITHTQRV